MTSALSDLEQALLSLDRVRAAEIVEQAATNGSPLDVIEQLVRPVLERIGERWEAGDCALSQVYMSGRICEELLNRLLGDPTQAGLALTSPGRRAPRLAIAVLDDYHMLGKQIVRTVVRASGYPIEDLGRVDVETLVDKVAAQRHRGAAGLDPDVASGAACGGADQAPGGLFSRHPDRGRRCAIPRRPAALARRRR
jgi:trimethylamine corrinoid protein